jgi:hypothetical protein
MPVQIDEVEVVPRQSEQPGPSTAAPVPVSGQRAQSPELAHEIAQTVAILQSRDLRLHAD